MSARQVLSVGQCFADHGAISRALQQAFGAEVVSAATFAEARDYLAKDAFALVLVNRVLDADGASGLEWIRQIKAESNFQQQPIMLVSNYEDAQQQAVDAGALPGFGKAALGQPRMLERLKHLLN